ncbi:hypothetical protein [Dyadobacter sp. CY312]|uniref:hypothetical protein n=1 Tax=Dyadobacter sp. CY312 TaxID=2907303 RepID=UPI001F18333E|nr:hypothetical protein [Dyadobacter sp. CY312]MCE7043579.1 hypothetical protein [Dyadobacter sp. CY312]
MKLQYIADSEGITTGVYIPISDWEELKTRFKGIEEEETYDIPEWHKDVVLSRLEEFKKNPEYALDFESAMDDLEKNI